MLLTGAFSVSLSLLKAGMLGCVAMDVSDSSGGNWLRVLSPGFPWWDELSGVDLFLDVVLPGASL
jgi:hypothetical protein